MTVTTAELFRSGDVRVLQIEDTVYNRPPFLIVTDERSFRLRLSDGAAARPLCVEFSCATSQADHCLHGMMDYTSCSDGSGPPDCAIGEVQITEGGLLSAMARQRALYDFRIGWAVQLPSDAVAAVRHAIRLAEARASGETPAVQTALPF